MKPTMQGEVHKVAIGETVVAPTEKGDSKTGSRKKLVIGGVVAVVTLCVITCVILGAVYLGSEVAKDNYKAAWITYNNEKFEKPIEEKVVVTDREVDVTNPGVVRVIADYESDRLVIQYNGPLEGNMDATCYVSDMEDYLRDIDIKDVKESITALHLNRTAKMEQKHTYVHSKEMVDFNSLSPRAQEMCLGVNIVKVEPKPSDSLETQEDTMMQRKKRGCVGRLWCGTYCLIWYCQDYCFALAICSSS